MKFINIKNIKKYFIMLLTVVVISCADENLKPIITFDDAGHGAYPRLVEETGDLLLNVLTQATFDASQYTYTVKFIDEKQGANVASFVLSLEYEDVTKANSAGPVEFRSYSASDFTDSEGNVAMANINITSADVMSKFGLVYADIHPGDKMKISGVMTMTNGNVHTGPTSSATVNGTAFQGYFDFTMPIGCPSDLTGSFDYVTTNAWCDGTGTTGTVDIVALGGGVYTFDDFSFGAYSICYSPTSVADQPTVNFTEVCEEVSFTGFKDSYGDTWTFVSSITGNDWNISWSNTYGEAGDAVITFPNGVPFTLVP